MKSLEILQHPKAPLFSSSDGEIVLKQLLSEIASGHITQDETLRQAWRQAGFVNLWFFLKHICSYGGPYGNLNDDLHVDMCNFRQNLLQPGTRGAMFIPRSHYKCETSTTPLFTLNRGELLARDIRPGDTLPGLCGPTEVIATDKSLEPCWRVSLKNGTAIDVADFHYFYTSHGWQPAVEVDDIKVGGSWFPGEIIDEDYFLGLLYGDGGFTGGMITITTADEEILSFIKSFWGDVTYKGRYDYSLRGCKAWLLEKNVPLVTSPKKEYPYQYEGSVGFLRGLFDSDGCVLTQARCITFTSSSESLAVGVMRNLSYFGIRSSLHTRPNRKAYYVNIHEVENIKRFQRIIGFGIARKQEALRSISITRRRKPINWTEGCIKVKDKIYIGLKEVTHIQVKDGVYLERTGLVSHNTTIVTEGGSAWELLRNPTLAIRISNAIADFAHGFKLSVKAIFDQNDLVKWLYGQKQLDGESWVPESEENWNRSCMIMPNRKRYRREHSIESGGATGAAESHHFDLHIGDDLIGMAALDSMRRTSALMQHTKNWFWANEDTLLTTPKRGRIIIVGTRYAVDDLYSEIISKAHKVVGAELRSFPYDEERSKDAYKWQVYYRKCIEDGKVIFPEEYSLADYDRMAKEKWWEYVTQYLNDPQESGLAELNSYKPRTFIMEQRGTSNASEWLIVYKSYNYAADEEEVVELPLSDLDVIMAIDPAATEKYISAKTSRSAIGILAQDWNSNKFLISLRADYISPSKLFDEVFKEHRRFGRYIRNTFLEANAGFKVLGPLLRDEERKRGQYIGLKPFPSIGDKDARIRSTLQPELDAGRLFIHEVHLRDVEEELNAFPQSHKKDIIDMLSIAVSNSRAPLAPDELQRRKHLNDQWSKRPQNAVGY